MGGTLLSQVPQLTWFTRESGNLTRVEVTNNYDHQDLKRERREEREKERNDIGKRGDWSSKSSRWLVRNVIVIIIVASKRNFTCGHAMWKSDHDCYQREMQIWHIRYTHTHFLLGSCLLSFTLCVSLSLSLPSPNGNWCPPLSNAMINDCIICGVWRDP